MQAEPDGPAIVFFLYFLNKLEKIPFSTGYL